MSYTSLSEPFYESIVDQENSPTIRRRKTIRLDNFHNIQINPKCFYLFHKWDYITLKDEYLVLSSLFTQNTLYYQLISIIEETQGLVTSFWNGFDFINAINYLSPSVVKIDL